MATGSDSGGREGVAVTRDHNFDGSKRLSYDEIITAVL